MHDNTVFNTIPDQRPDTPLLDRVETPEQLREVIRRDQLVPWHVNCAPSCCGPSGSPEGISAVGLA